MTWQPDYATPTDLKAYVVIDDDVDNAQIALALTAASRAIDTATGRQFGVVTAEARTYTPRLDRRLQRFRPRWVVDVDDFMTTAGLVVTVGGATVTTFAKHPSNADKIGRPWEQLVFDSRSGVVLFGDDDEVSVTAAWGWTAVPDTIKQATLLQASRVFSRRKSPFGIAGSPDVGSELRLLDKVDPDVQVMVQDYVRVWGAV